MIFGEIRRRGLVNHVKISTYRRYSSDETVHAKDYYDLLGIPRTASLKEIKMQFKKLTKQYHPDLNSHLGEQEKESNSKKYVEIVNAYNTLKEPLKRKGYDSSMHQGTGDTNSVRRNDEWFNKYYGEAKYYSKSGGPRASPHRASGFSTKRHRVRPHNGYENRSMFSGEHRNYGDRFGVPHFDYGRHLAKHLRFEQRILNRYLTETERSNILRQLSKDGNLENINEELITKYLRQMHNTRNDDLGSRNFEKEQKRDSADNGSRKKADYVRNNPHMYHDRDENGGLKTTLFCLGAGGGIYLLYNAIGK